VIVSRDRDRMRLSLTVTVVTVLTRRRARFRSEATFYGVSREMRPRDWAGALPPLARKSGTRTEQQWR
jgi:hypothetical protein